MEDEPELAVEGSGRARVPVGVLVVAAGGVEVGGREQATRERVRQIEVEALRRLASLHEIETVVL